MRLHWEDVEIYERANGVIIAVVMERVTKREFHVYREREAARYVYLLWGDDRKIPAGCAKVAKRMLDDYAT